MSVLSFALYKNEASKEAVEGLLEECLEVLRNGSKPANKALVVFIDDSGNDMHLYNFATGMLGLEFLGILQLAINTKLDYMKGNL